MDLGPARRDRAPHLGCQPVTPVAWVQQEISLHVDMVFMSVNASDFEALPGWWRTLLDRPWGREPRPPCRKWDVAGRVLFPVLDKPGQGGAATVTLHVANLDATTARLRATGSVPTDPDLAPVQGFQSLRFSSFEDPEGNAVGLLDGARWALTPTHRVRERDLTSSAARSFAGGSALATDLAGRACVAPVPTGASLRRPRRAGPSGGAAFNRGRDGVRVPQLPLAAGRR